MQKNQQNNNDKKSTRSIDRQVLSTEIKHCNYHNADYTSYTLKRYDGSCYYSGCDLCKHEHEYFKFCEEVDNYSKERKRQRLVKMFNNTLLLPYYNSKTFDDYIVTNGYQEVVKSAMLEFAQNIESNLKQGCNLILTGNRYTGKTHLSIALARTALDKGFTVLSTNVFGIVSRVNEASFWSHKSLVMDNYVIPDLLILDNLAKLNHEEHMILSKIIYRRAEYRKSTILHTNLPIPILSELLGEKVISCLRSKAGTTVLMCCWDKYQDA